MQSIIGNGAGNTPQDMQCDTSFDDFSNDEIKKLLRSAEQRLKQATSSNETAPRLTKPVNVSPNSEADSSYMQGDPTLDSQGPD